MAIRCGNDHQKICSERVKEFPSIFLTSFNCTSGRRNEIACSNTPSKFVRVCLTLDEPEENEIISPPYLPLGCEKSAMTVGVEGIRQQDVAYTCPSFRKIINCACTCWSLLLYKTAAVV